MSSVEKAHSLSADLLLDRIDEICQELHSSRHSSSSSSSSSFRSKGLSKRLIAQSMPLHDNASLCDFITSRISAEQRSLVSLLWGEKAMNDHVLDVDIVEDIKEDITLSMQRACHDLADGLMAKMLVRIVAECLDGFSAEEVSRVVSNIEARR
jgi:hypothetical protein